MEIHFQPQKLIFCLWFGTRFSINLICSVASGDCLQSRRLSKPMPPMTVQYDNRLMIPVRVLLKSEQKHNETRLTQGVIVV